ncbi:hypothetical protein [Gracilimonas sp.]|uniref:hypothetical protein n=1 Tax=Gracilimonas sp. TaxID=1974203 RepID=UPI00287236E6|nr:hypothetical protein [Gracilimonas sp.]
MLSKKVLILSTLTALALFFTFGCSSSTGSGVNVPTGQVKANIDGEKWEAMGGTAVQISANIGGNSVTAVTVAAANVIDQSSGDSEVVEVTIYGSPGEDSISEGTYDVSENELPGAQFSFSLFVDDEIVSYFATSGTVEVTSVDDEEVKGTFEGTVERADDPSDTKDIENGQFNVGFGFSFGL